MIAKSTQSQFFHIGKVILLCKCCRKREALDGVRCKKCIEASPRNETQQGTPQRIVDLMRKHRPDDADHWIAALEGRQSGLRQRAKHRSLAHATRRDMVDQLIVQDFKCYFTGEPLKPDQELRLAHLEPACRGGAFTIDNLVWTTNEINQLIGRMNAVEFTRICVKIGNHHRNK